jgi:cation transport ATPase
MSVRPDLDRGSTYTTQANAVLSRPAEQRRREYKYRCAQAVIFGLPVLVLQWFGRSLGGSAQEVDRWVPLLQALLAGWVTFVGATGMIVEGAMSLTHAQTRATTVRVDALVGLIAALLYLFSAVSVLGIFLRAHPFYHPLLFHWVVIILAVWSAARWISMRDRIAH